ncbi:hypothetical protein H0H93_012091 [Arthromyces matolae]|nr:hypothetical protein H0H93_012091 [Arthromyces matolae]
MPSLLSTFTDLFMKAAPDTYVAQMSSNTNAQAQIATFASGCFWGTEHIFLKHFPPSENKGILKTSVGYTGGKEDASNPSYKQVCTGTTDHAEAVKIEFNPEIVSYAELVEYRSVIFTHDADQETIAKRITEEVQAKHFTPKGQKIVTEIISAGKWWDAEEYHQLYLFRNPNGYQCPTHRLHW